MTLKLINESLLNFWTSHPAFFFGLCTTFGASAALFNPYTSLLLLSLLLFTITYTYTPTFQQYKKALLALALATIAFVFCEIKYTFPDDEIIKGTAIISIDSLESSKTHFGDRIKYRATLLSMVKREKLLAKNIPVTFSLADSPSTFHPIPSQRYQLKATLKRSPQGYYTLTSIDKNSWEPLSTTWNFVAWRAAAKQNLKQAIEDRITNRQTAAFLSGIITGHYNDMLLATELARFGLQHIMAISGLHFSILATILGLFFGIFFSRRSAAIALIVAASLYLFFLGPSPSILRAWAAITIGVAAIIVERESIAINSLGAALLLVILWDPLAIGTIGFQFSFGITLSILLWTVPFDTLLKRLLPTHSLGSVITTPWHHQHARCFLVFVRKGLALLLAVNVVALPLTLYYFHTFPLMSLLYNLFFPAMVSLSMLLILFALIALPIPYLSHFLFSLTESYTQFLLNFALKLPKSFDANLRVGELNSIAILLLVTSVIFLGILLKARAEQNICYT